MKIAIIGAGNIGTHFAVCLASIGCEVSIYSPRFKEISSVLELVDETGAVLKSAKIALASDDLGSCVRGASVIFITTPVNTADELCAKLLPFVDGASRLCFVCGGGGVEFAFAPCLEKGASIYCLARVPSIARLVKYGKSVWASKPRDQLFISALNGAKSDDLLGLLERAFDCRVSFLKDFLSISLTGSNAILHTARLFVVFKDYEKGRFYESLPLFYEDWDDESSELLLELDCELASICGALEGFDFSLVKSIKEHYEIKTKSELSAKIRWVPAFKGLKTPSVFTQGRGFEPEWNSRYFTCDFGYGLAFLAKIAEILGLKVVKMNALLDWYNSTPNAKKGFDYIKSKNEFLDFYKKYTLAF